MAELRYGKSERPLSSASSETASSWWKAGLVVLLPLWFWRGHFGQFKPFDLLTRWGSLGHTICSASENVYTVDESRPRVECMYIMGSTIEAAGSLGDVENHWISTKPKFIPAVAWQFLHMNNVCYINPVSIIVPGLADAHGHIMEYGIMKELPLAMTSSIEEIIERIKNYIEEHPVFKDDPAQWINGWGWDHTKWLGSQFPTFADLDRDPMLKGRRISLTRIDGHARWVSQQVLELMGDLPDEIEGGHIVRDRDGKPTGVFVDNAMDLIPVPPVTEERLSAFFDLTMKDALSHGLTFIHDADARPDHVAVFKKKAEIGELPIRVYAMAHIPSNEYWGSQITKLYNYGKHKRLTLRSVKLFSDGALGSWGASLLEPYSDKPDTNGLLLVPMEVLHNLTTEFWRAGFQVGVHCIGDRANRNVLDIYERILLEEGADVSKWRPRIEHAQIFSMEDLERIGKLGVIASVQPTHATSDMSYAESRLGFPRIKGAYAYQTLHRASPNHVLPFGSDFPIESMNPLFGFYSAISRLDHNGSSPHGNGGWYPEERLTRAEALKGMTLDAAYAAFAEDTFGSLVVGKKADFVVLDRDIMTVPFSDILDTKILATVVDGKVAYQSPSSPPIPFPI